jgi:hypothetical protein
MKYGKVWEYSEALGWRPLSHMQRYVSELGSQVLAWVAAVAASSWRQIRGQAEIWEVHH